MARLTLHEKVDRVMRLLLALRRRTVASALSAHGFAAAEIQEAFRLLAALTVTDLEGAASVIDRPDLEEKIAAWEHRWFPIVEAALRRHHPDALERLFPKIVDGMAEGHAKQWGNAIFFLNAFDTLGATSPAIARLHERGLTPAVITELRNVLDPMMHTLDASPWPKGDSAAFTEAEEKLWAWYLEWSSIVRARVKDKRLLRELGFGADHAHVEAG